MSPFTLRLLREVGGHNPLAWVRKTRRWAHRYGTAR